MIIRPETEVFSFSPWGWYRLKGVATVLNETSGKKLRPSQVLLNFGNLSSKAHIDILEVTHGSCLERVRISQLILREQHFELTRSAESGMIYVNAGWANEVFDAHNTGFVQVDILTCMGETSYEDDCLIRKIPIKGTTEQFFAIVGRKVV